VENNIEQLDKLDTSDVKLRISNIHKDIWIDCPSARRPLDAILTLLDVPNRTTAPCMLVCGAGGSGKTTIVNQLMKMNRGLGSPMVFLSLAENPSNLKFKHLILEAIGLPVRLAVGRDMLSKDVANYIHLHGIKALVIDEFHESMLVTRSEQLKNLSLLKALSGSPYNLIVIGFGVRAAKNALQHDEQLARRFHTHDLLPWVLDDGFRNFLATLEKKVKLKKPSMLHQEEMVRLIHNCSGGTMDNVVKIIKSAASYAITTGEECITKEIIAVAVAEPWGYYQKGFKL
jgi:hypothetical protein